MTNFIYIKRANVNITCGLCNSSTNPNNSFLQCLWCVICLLWVMRSSLLQYFFILTWRYILTPFFKIPSDQMGGECSEQAIFRKSIDHLFGNLQFDFYGD